MGNLIKGWERGEVIIPFDSENSLLIELTTKLDNPDELRADKLDLLMRWIDEGAKNDDGDIPYEDSTNLLYVCDQNEAKISVIDVNARLVIRTVDLLDHHSEFVKSGAVEEDSELTLFHGVPFEDGEEILFFWEADFIEDKTIPPFEMRTATYTVSGPFASEALDVSVRLRFRSFPPYFLRAIGEDDLLDELIIFDMENFEGTINVN